jgi:hypothetical protein
MRKPMLTQIAALMSFTASQALAFTLVLPSVGEIKLGPPDLAFPTVAPQNAPEILQPNQDATEAPKNQKPNRLSTKQNVSVSSKDDSLSRTNTKEMNRRSPLAPGELTYEAALKCAGLLEFGNLIKHPRLIDLTVQANASIRAPVWDKVIALHPIMSKLPFDEAERMRKRALDKYMSDHYFGYKDDIELLRRDYINCKAVGIFNF